MYQQRMSHLPWNIRTYLFPRSLTVTIYQTYHERMSFGSHQCWAFKLFQTHKFVDFGWIINSTVTFKTTKELSLLFFNICISEMSISPAALASLHASYMSTLISALSSAMASPRVTNFSMDRCTACPHRTMEFRDLVGHRSRGLYDDTCKHTAWGYKSEKAWITI